MRGGYLVPANAKRGTLYFNIFRGIDLIIFASGIIVSVFMLGVFSSSSLIVTLDKAISAVNKIHSKDFFNNVAIKSIKDLTYINDNSPNIANFNSVNFRQILEIELMESSKENFSIR